MTSIGAKQLLLVSADQMAVVFDLRDSRRVRRFPVRAIPAVRVTVNECAPVVAGADWMATANLRTGVVSFYDHSGRDLGPIRVNRLMQTPSTLMALGGAGRYLAAAAGGIAQVWEVGIDGGCATANELPAAR
jgi:hypothetical protein